MKFEKYTYNQDFAWCMASLFSVERERVGEGEREKVHVENRVGWDVFVSFLIGAAFEVTLVI